ncbi:YwmB family TATA-box binding protein [Brevibacillus sp. GCM10020057]|uniref:YwmB family TATA-box binding protein n=1 Tax=Brevibacillus sp. GCM10020057 TaxID=3317327 RepID=UPI00363FD516
MGKWSGTVALAVALVMIMGAIWRMPAEATGEKPVAAQLLRVLEDSGATAKTIQVRARASMGMVDSTEKVKELAERWAGQLEIPFSHVEISRKHQLIAYETEIVQEGVRVSFGVSGVSKNGSFDSYLVLELTGGPQSLLYMENMQKSFANALKKADFIPQISTCIRGMYNDKMSVDQQEGKILSIFQSLQASELERLQDETVVSISGYTRMWEPFIALNGQKMNLQVATHRDSDSSGTWITVGTPIITVEY